MEFSGTAPDAARGDEFARAIDLSLSRGNDDYRAHRSGLDPPDIRVVAHGAFAAWMKSRGRLGGQNKVPRVINDPVLFDSLRAFMTEHAA